MCDVPREDMTGAELAAARQSMGLTVAELADLLGIADHKRIRQWEKGHTNHGDPPPIHPRTHRPTRPHPDSPPAYLDSPLPALIPDTHPHPPAPESGGRP